MVVAAACVTYTSGVHITYLNTGMRTIVKLYGCIVVYTYRSTIAADRG